METYHRNIVLRVYQVEGEPVPMKRPVTSFPNLADALAYAQGEIYMAREQGYDTTYEVMDIENLHMGNMLDHFKARYDKKNFGWTLDSVN